MKFVAVILSLTWLLPACLPTSRSVVTNPMEDTWQSIRRDYPEAFGVRVLGMRNRSENEVAVIYTYNLPPKGDDSGSHFTGVSTYRRASTGGWQLSGGAGAGSPDNPPADQLLDYFSVHGEGTAIYGRTLTSEVAVIEADLSDGQMIRDEAGDQAFALFSPQGVKVCRLRALNANGELLRENDFTSDEAGDPCR